MLPSVCSVQNLERLASVEALLLFKYCPCVKYFNVLIVEIVTGDSSLFKHHLRKGREFPSVLEIGTVLVGVL